MPFSLCFTWKAGEVFKQFGLLGTEPNWLLESLSLLFSVAAAAETFEHKLIFANKFVRPDCSEAASENYQANEKTGCSID